MRCELICLLLGFLASSLDEVEAHPDDCDEADAADNDARHPNFACRL